MNYKHWDKGRWNDVIDTFKNTQIKDGEHIHSFTSVTKTQTDGRNATSTFYDEFVANTKYTKLTVPTIIFDLFIEKLIFNGPTTIVLWKDGTKTVIKCKEGDTDNKEFAFLYAIVERLYTGLKGSKNEFKRFLDKYISQAEKEEAEKNEKRAHKEKKKPESLDKKVILKTADIIDVDLPNSNSSYCSNCHTILSPGVIYSECPKCHLIFEKHIYQPENKKENNDC